MQPRDGGERGVEPFAAVLDMGEAAVFEELIVTFAKDDQVGFVMQHFLEDRREPISRIRDAAAIDDSPATARVGGVQAEFQPGRKGCLYRVRAALHRRSAQTKDAILVVGLLGRERLRAEVRLPAFGNFVPRAVFARHEQRPDRPEADERIVLQLRPAPITKPAQPFEGDQE